MLSIHFSDAFLTAGVHILRALTVFFLLASGLNNVEISCVRPFCNVLYVACILFVMFP